MTSPNPSFPPAELMTGTRRWLCADANGKPIPGTAAADSTHWTNYDAAWLRVIDGNADSVGLSLTGRYQQDGRTLLIIDLDSCFTGGTLDGWADALARKFDTYMEVSQSGRGLHIFVWSEKAEYEHTKRYVETVSETEGKAPQVQIFGGIEGSNYVRVTCNRYAGSPDTIQQVTDIDFVEAMFPAKKGTEMAQQVSERYIKTTFTKEELTDRVREWLGRDESLVEGDWQTTKSKSASEAYFRLVTVALRAAGGDGELVLEWLLDPACNAWATGNVESADPKKYAKPEWVENRVRKATAVLEPERPDWNSIVQSEEEQATEPGEQELFLPVGKFRKLFNTRAAFMVENLIPNQGVVQVYGQPGSGKSLWALSLSYAIATGAERWFGLAVEKHGPVLVLVGEDPSGVAGRTEAQEKLLGLDVAPEIYLSREPLDITETGSFEKLAKVAHAIQPKLVVIDTQIANAGDLDENDTQQMARFIKRCEAMAQGLDCVVLLVHHQSKTGKGGARGSSVQAGAVIANFQATMNGDTVQLRPVKTKNWKRLPQLRAQIRTEEAGPPSKTGHRARYPVLDSSQAPDWLKPEEAEDKEPVLVKDQHQQDPAKELRTFSEENGRMSRVKVAEHMSKLGVVHNTEQLRRLERKLQTEGLKVDSTRGKDGGVIYS